MRHHQIEPAKKYYMPDEYQIRRAEMRQQQAIQRKGFRNDPIAEDRSGSGEGPHVRHHIHRKGR
jgi:hypothetical protein